MASFGEFLNQQRRQRGWSLKRLGEELTSPQTGAAVSPQYLNDIEKGRRVPSDDILAQLANVFRLDVSYLKALAARGLPEVRDYLRLNPEASPELGQMFRRARATGFTDWKGVEKMIEQRRKTDGKKK